MILTHLDQAVVVNLVVAIKRSTATLKKAVPYNHPISTNEVIAVSPMTM